MSPDSPPPLLPDTIRDSTFLKRIVKKKGANFRIIPRSLKPHVTAAIYAFRHFRYYPPSQKLLPLDPKTKQFDETTQNIL